MRLFLATYLLFTFAAYAADEPSLLNELSALESADNRAPATVTGEKLYAVQSRYTPLRFRHELTVGGATNFTSDGYITSNQLEAGYRFYLSNRWFVGLSGSYVFNDFNSSGLRLLQETGLLPDAVFTKYRGDFSLGYNLFYGKFRLSMDQVFYFDLYVSLGPGVVQYFNGREAAAVGDIGLAGWIGQTFTVRVGFKDYFASEIRQKSRGMTHNVLGHVDLGVLL